MRLPCLGILLAVAGVTASPALAQEPAAVAPGTRIIFFGWDKPEIDSDAAALLDEIAASFARSPGARVILAGHADRSGPAAQNLRSSQRRAEAVRDFLTQRGVPPGAISITFHGEERPIVATEDGVREPQNRRVEIRLLGAVAAQGFSLAAADGGARGTVSVSEGASGIILTVAARGLPPGVHGIHLHETGLCEGPAFASAGKHVNPAGKEHGRDNPAGAHLGDLGNLEVGADGAAAANYSLANAHLADADGTALVIHALADDERTDPSGNSGGRIACAVLATPK